MSRLCSDVHENLDKTLTRLCGEMREQNEVSSDGKLLDIGCWDGQKTRKYADVLGVDDRFGIEIFDEQIAQAQQNGVEVAKLDLEQDNFPFENDTFDVIICNQVFEHLKQIYHPLDEIHRVLKPGGHFLFSVPNLSSLHNRIMLRFGMQPSSIRLFGPHVRAFAYHAFIDFATYNENFKLVKRYGIGFYPFSSRFGGDFLSRHFKSLSHTPILLLQKNGISEKRVLSWNDRIQENEEQTVF
ncbi:MAG: class I SAM-dependent methyltransferase [Calditrichaeota bacterium]|nr:MAG: class I SAM-dependent methyltransferase [Calditrichota bacterium]